ncbi:MAG: DUF3047 domain-containing protein [Paracoccaceae bacterium]
MTRVLKTLLAAALLSGPAVAGPMPFDGSWQEQGFLWFFNNSYKQNGDALSVGSDGTVSILYRPVPDGFRASQRASWDWSVSETVPPTDLTLKGGDDRNLAMYFVFTDRKTAETVNPKNLRRLLRNPNIRVLAYVWGGAHERGQILPSPYMDTRGVTVVRRPAGTGAHGERVDLSRDLKAAFGTRPEALIGVAVSADSDDTDTRVRAAISDLRLD